jgi:hypothetical protein
LPASATKTVQFLKKVIPMKNPAPGTIFTKVDFGVVPVKSTCHTPQVPVVIVVPPLMDALPETTVNTSGETSVIPPMAVDPVKLRSFETAFVEGSKVHN